jgi:hypothetical protein
MSWGVVIVDISLITSDDLTDDLMFAIFKDIQIFLAYFHPKLFLLWG